ncbi:MAG: putative dienelactone hydrolase [Planctomycetaceae bacterium]|nr:putative dienelactone hydrolase [Planctomycetaceae bacterium]
MTDNPADRREFLASLGWLPFLGATGLAVGEGSSQVFADPARELLPSSADLGTNFSFVEQIAATCRPSLFPIGQKVEFNAAFRTAAREKLREVLSYEPDRVDFRPEVVERVDCGDYWRERVLISTTPWFRIPAYVLIPKGLKNPAPAIVDLHSHGGMFLFGKEKVIDLGTNHPAMTKYHQQNYAGRPTATALVKRGYVVITIDAFMFGERRVLLDEDLKFGWDRSKYSLDDVQQLNQKCRAKESTIAKSLVLAGATWPGVVNFDDRRVVEYLTTRPEVAAARIGCVGISMGGYRSAYLAANDERIKAACVVGFMSSMRPMLKSHVDTHSWIHFLPGLHRLMDFPELVSLTAPRALFVQQCSQDRLFPLAGMQSSVQRIAELYESAGSRDQFLGRFYDEPHHWTIAMQDEAFAWLDDKLQHRSTQK